VIKSYAIQRKTQKKKEIEDHAGIKKKLKRDGQD
jgi:hypothetical protein